MNAMRNVEDPRQETYNVARELDERAEVLATVGLDFGPGDVLLFPDSREDGVEWLMVDKREARRHLVVIDDSMLVGSHDHVLPFDALGGEATVHCDVDAWVGDTQLQRATRTGHLPEVNLAQVRRKLRDVQSGRVKPTLIEEEVESSFEYQDWIATLKRERDDLLEQATSAPVEPLPLRTVATSKRNLVQWLALAATIVLSIGLGLQTQQLQKALKIEREQLTQIEDERKAERHELEASLAEAERREAEARELSEQAQNENSEKQERISELETSLRDALKRRIRFNIPDIELTWDGRTRRVGDPLVYRFEKGQESAIVSLAVVDPEPYDSYRLRIYNEDGKVAYENDQMQKMNGQWLRLDLPAGFLPAGKYRLVVDGVRDGKFTKIEDAEDWMRLLYSE